MNNDSNNNNINITAVMYKVITLPNAYRMRKKVERTATTVLLLKRASICFSI